MSLHRRALLKGMASVGLLTIIDPIASMANEGNQIRSAAPSNIIFNQEPLPYSFDALEPIIDAQTMNIHYSKHAAAYVKNLNEACAEMKFQTSLSQHDALLNILGSISKYSSKMRNNAGGHFNHEFFWKCMCSPKNKTIPGPASLKAIESDFGDINKMKEAFSTKAKTIFGSGWAWLIIDEHRKLKIVQTANQDNPLMDITPKQEVGIPVLALDVWEHAYYLKHQNKRADYIQAWWEVVDWNFVERQIAAGIN
jgi:Fe-Mn family superoxide dismutase